MTRSGRPLADKPTHDLRLRLPTALLAKISAAADRDGRSRDAWIRRAIEAALTSPSAKK